MQRAPFLGAYVKGDSLILDNLDSLLNNLESFKLTAITQVEIDNLIEQYEKSYEEKVQLKDIDKQQFIEKMKIGMIELQTNF